LKLLLAVPYQYEEADVDEGEEAGEDAGERDSVCGDVHGRVHLADPLGKGQTVITGKGEASTVMVSRLDGCQGDRVKCVVGGRFMANSGESQQTDCFSSANDAEKT
jgi:hypothetical protein